MTNFQKQYYYPAENEMILCHFVPGVTTGVLIKAAMSRSKSNAFPKMKRLW